MIYIIILVIILILTSLGISNQINKDIKNKYFPVKNISYHKVDPAFSFEYPEIKGMVAQIKHEPLTTNGEIIYLYDRPTLLTIPLPRISWDEISIKVTEDYWDSKPKNKNGLAYSASENKDSITFRLPKQGTSIEVDLSLTYEYKKQIYETLLNSFTEDEEFIDVKSLADSNISDEGLVAIIAELRKQNKNPADFYAKFIRELSPTAVSYELLHKDSLKPENFNKVGNPSGKNMKATYSLHDKKVLLLISK